MFKFRIRWDPIEARSNWLTYGISFDLAATVFRDPLMLTIPDGDHGEADQRWLTLARAKKRVLLVVIHTYQELGANSAEVRIFFARRATRRERGQYEKNL